MIATKEDFAAGGTVKEIELPCKLTVRVKSLSLIDFFSNGALPNHLLNEAYTLFFTESSPEKHKVESGVEFAKKSALITHVVRNVLVQPDFDEVKVYFSDNDYMAIYDYVMKAGGMLKAAKSTQKPANEVRTGVSPEVSLFAV